MNHSAIQIFNTQKPRHIYKVFSSHEPRITPTATYFTTIKVDEESKAEKNFESLTHNLIILVDFVITSKIGNYTRAFTK